MGRNNELLGQDPVDPTTGLDLESRRKSSFDTASTPVNQTRLPRDPLGQTPKVYGLDLESYTSYLGDVNVLDPNIDRDRARAQGAGEQFLNATGRVLANTVPTIVGNLAAIVDIEDYYNQDNEIGNSLTRAMQEFKEDVNQALPIYRTDPQKALDWRDSGWWFENGSGLVESIAAFAGTGLITGGVLGGALARLGQAGQGAATVLNAAALNQAEAISSAITVYDDLYKDYRNRGFDDATAKKECCGCCCNYCTDKQS